MGTRTGNPTWQNWPSTTTPITAAALEAIEREIDVGTGGGVTDHGALTGLLDDDHPQYARVADAVPLSTATPLPAGVAGFAGTDATAAHGLHVHPKSGVVVYRDTTTDRLYLPPGYVGSATDCATGAYDVWVMPFEVRGGFRIVSVQGQCTAAVALSKVRVGLYVGTTGLPVARVADFGEFTTTSTGSKTITLGTALDVTEGFYFLVASANLTGVGLGGMAAAGGQWVVPSQNIAHTDNRANGIGGMGYSGFGSSLYPEGTCPSPFVLTEIWEGSASVMPRIGIFGRGIAA